MASSILVGSANVTSATSPTVPPPNVNIIHGTHSQLIAFLVLNIWPSHFAIPLLFVVIYFRKIERHATFINLGVTFIIAGISSTLLLYAGKTTGPEPAPVLCLLQASLLYGYPPMTSVAVFALVSQVFLVARATYYKEEYVEKNHLVRTWALMIAPYIACLAVVLATVIVGATNPSNVSRNRRFFYCSVKADPLTNFLTVFAALFLLGSVFIEGQLLSVMYKRYTFLKSQGFNVKHKMDYSMPLRVVALGVYSTIALSLSLLSIRAPESPVPDLMIATAPSVFFLLFVTQREIVNGLRFWRKKPSETRSVEITVAKEETSFYNYDQETRCSSSEVVERAI
ncbi:hypothetical protein H2248_005922 [Termitomyces sp. 'cryptogamus']|nr:hypothetical protein H2248_005922 [Termitomyces sp. 'cryptogamus']